MSLIEKIIDECECLRSFDNDFFFGNKLVIKDLLAINFYDLALEFLSLVFLFAGGLQTLDFIYKIFNSASFTHLK